MVELLSFFAILVFSSTLCTLIVGKACDDINECAEDVNNNCDKVTGACVNKEKGDSYPLGYMCTCDNGYELSANGFTCVDINECRCVFLTLAPIFI